MYCSDHHHWANGLSRSPFPKKDMKKLLLATRNPGKVRELAALLEGCPLSLTTLAEEEIDREVDEVGESLEENAILKARTYMEASGLPCLADDSALEVEALDGEPGVLSKRYGGLEEAPDSARVDFLLKKLENIQWEQRTARFVCVIAIAWPKGSLDLYEGECPGKITTKPAGKSGFGYDPIFYLPELGKTMAQLSFEEKNRLSHRGKSARKALEALKHKADHR